MRKRGAMEATFAAVRDGSVDILIGTQMLSKGHDFANVTLVGIVDADSQLFSTDFRAEERLAQTIIQVAGRAGRAAIPGEVLIQTHHPHHELLQTLITDGYDRFVERALTERRLAALPPYVSMALIRAESPKAGAPLNFLRVLRENANLPRGDGIDILGPIPAAMEKKAGRYRAQLMVTANSRKTLGAGVRALIEASEASGMTRSVRWSIDIDPQDTL
jgi:primosomal protein N' (replication factor Y)